jgi:hypothetical protein
MEFYNGVFPVCYGQFYFLSEDLDWDGALEECFSRQNNGLCGVSIKGVVFFITGLHTGDITLTVNQHDSAPEIDNEADEIVEASFIVPPSGLNLEAWGEEVKIKLGISQGSYKLRYSVKNFGLAEDTGQYEEGNIEFYHIDIWPAPISQDKILKNTSEGAKYWHEEVKNF